jgi:glycosyltransferase involved in cell wall biosynthesis
MPEASEPWCAIPVYNNAATIADIAGRCVAQFAHVIVVDDGSTDADLRTLLKDLPVTVLRHETNQGKGAALAAAFRHAAERGGQYIITLDGDGQHFPEDIPRFLSHLAGDVILLGERREISGSMPRSSLFGRDFSDFWIEVETGAAVRDSQSGFRAYPLPAVLSLPLNSRHYNFEMEILTRALWAGLKVESVPIRVWYPPTSERVSSFRPFVDNLRISLIHTRLVARQLLCCGTGVPPVSLPGRNQHGRDARATASRMNPSAAAAVGIFFGILLWPIGIVPAFYVAWRLHLNKIAVLVAVAICMPRAWHRWSAQVGRAMLRESSLRWQAFVGLHIVAATAAIASAILVYLITQRLRNGNEHRQSHPR